MQLQNLIITTITKTNNEDDTIDFHITLQNVTILINFRQYLTIYRNSIEIAWIERLRSNRCNF